MAISAARIFHRCEFAEPVLGFQCAVIGMLFAIIHLDIQSACHSQHTDASFDDGFVSLNTRGGIEE
jgi:hypothetical protein